MFDFDIVREDDLRPKKTRKAVEIQQAETFEIK